MTEQKISEAFSEIAELAKVLDVKDIGKLPGCWEYQIDDQWWIAVNGHSEAIECSTGSKVDPFNCYVQYNGWPAGLFDPYGGTIAAGTGANEDNFIAAIKAAIDRVSA